MLITRSAYNQLIEVCQKHLPQEACGILCGTSGTEGAIIHQIRSIRNRSLTPATHFQFDAVEWMNALFEERTSAMNILALFHSHPLTSAEPSRQDLEHFHYPQYAYWIISLQEPSSVQVRAWKLKENTRQRSFVPFHFSIIEDLNPTG